MTSHAPKECCTVGVKHEGSSVGEIKNIGGCEFLFVQCEIEFLTNYS
jgi:hypothetical protein